MNQIKSHLSKPVRWAEITIQNRIIHKITDDELNQCWKFGLEYFLDNKKDIQARNGGQKRGVGGVLDSFINKIIEIAVCKELSKLNKNIECLTDFKIHPLNKGKTEPDVIRVIEKNNKIERNPNVYVEIKNISHKDNWLGPKADEIKSIQKNNYQITDTKKMFYVYGEIIDSKQSNNDRHSNILGVYMKKLIPEDPTLKVFHDISNLSVEIKYVFSVHDIQKLGVSFPKGGYMTSPEIFNEPAEKTKLRILKYIPLDKYKKMNIQKNILPKETGVFLTKTGGKKIRLPYPESFGDIKFRGKINMYEEKMDSVINHFFHCLSNVKVSSDALGNWTFKKDDVQNFKIVYSGKDPELAKDNIFVARRNQKITDKLCAKRLANIAKEI